MSARLVWRIRQSRRMAGEAASVVGPLRLWRRLLSPVASRAGSGPIVPDSASPASRSARLEKGSSGPAAKADAGVLDVLLDLPFLPTGSRIAELGLEQEVADHGREPCVDPALLAAANLIDGRSHIVVDAPPRHATQNAEGVVMGVEQHLVGLLEIGPENEGAAVGELEVGDLQFGPLSTDDRPVFRPVELEGFARQKRQRNVDATAAAL